MFPFSFFSRADGSCWVSIMPTTTCLGLKGFVIENKNVALTTSNLSNL